MNKESNRGLFLTFEGIDGSGKSTQANALLRRLQEIGQKVVLYREPGGTRISEQIRQTLLSRRHREMSPMTELLLYSAARAQLTDEMILPGLEENDVVICDRYYDSTYAYQGFGRGIDLKLIDALIGATSERLSPDITFVVEVDLEVANVRARSLGITDRIEEEPNEFKTRVIEGYRWVAENNPDRVKLLDGSKSVDELSEIVWASVKPLIPSIAD